MVGRSGYLAKVLEVLASGPRRVTDIAQEIQVASGATEDGRYQLVDRVFGL